MPLSETLDLERELVEILNEEISEELLADPKYASLNSIQRDVIRAWSKQRGNPWDTTALADLFLLKNSGEI